MILNCIENLLKDKLCFKAIVILNNHFEGFENLVQEISLYANLLVCCDGAANLFDKVTLSKVNCFLGDMDSIDKKAEEAILSEGKTFMKIPDQDTNDMEKAINYIDDSISKIDMQSFESKNILIVGVSGGRADHTFANMHVCMKSVARFKDFQIISLSKNCLSYFFPGLISFTLRIRGPLLKSSISAFNCDHKKGQEIALISFTNGSESAKLYVQTNDKEYCSEFIELNPSMFSLEYTIVNIEGYGNSEFLLFSFIYK